MHLNNICVLNLICCLFNELHLFFVCIYICSTYNININIHILTLINYNLHLNVFFLASASCCKLISSTAFPYIRLESEQLLSLASFKSRVLAMQLIFMNVRP